MKISIFSMNYAIDGEAVSMVYIKNKGNPIKSKTDDWSVYGVSVWCVCAKIVWVLYALRRMISREDRARTSMMFNCSTVRVRPLFFFSQFFFLVFISISFCFFPFFPVHENPSLRAKILSIREHNGKEQPRSPNETTVSVCVCIAFAR